MAVGWNSCGELGGNARFTMVSRGLSPKVENAVAEALRKAGKDLVYFKRDDSTLEEDFFLRTVDSLVPVEVKARSGTSKSLKTLISSDHYPDIRFGVKLHAGNIGFSDGIWTFPLFCAFLLPDVLPQLPRQ